jgi:hypothetical protein
MRVTILSKVVDQFEHDGATIEIHLEVRGETLVVLARYAGGDLINGYEYHVDNIVQMDAEVASTINPVKELFAIAKDAVLTRQWERYNQSLVDAGLLRRIPS